MNSPRTSFIRIGDKAGVLALVKEAKRVGYKVEKHMLGKMVFAYVVTDPGDFGLGTDLVFRSTNVRPGLWTTSYSLKYWDEPAIVEPRTPTNFQKFITANPDPK